MARRLDRGKLKERREIQKEKKRAIKIVGKRFLPQLERVVSILDSQHVLKVFSETNTKELFIINNYDRFGTREGYKLRFVFGKGFDVKHGVDYWQEEPGILREYRRQGLDFPFCKAADYSDMGDTPGGVYREVRYGLDLMKLILKEAVVLQEYDFDMEKVVEEKIEEQIKKLRARE